MMSSELPVIIQPLDDRPYQKIGMHAIGITYGVSLRDPHAGPIGPGPVLFFVIALKIGSKFTGQFQSRQDSVIQQEVVDCINPPLTVVVFFTFSHTVEKAAPY